MSKKKVLLFLDIDGVLNACGVPGYDDHERTEERFHGFIGICPERVKLLNEIIERTGAEVVMSSTWRLGSQEHFDEVLEYMAKQGFTGKVIGRTPNNAQGFSNRGRRGCEVREWLKENADRFKPHGFTGIHHAIVDDDDDFDSDQPLHLTRYYKGLTRECVEKLVAMLTPEVEK